MTLVFTEGRFNHGAAAPDQWREKMEKIEYRVRPVTRYVVTRYEEDGRGAGSEPKGEFDNYETAYAVGYALAQSDMQRLGYPPGDTRVMFPEPLQEEPVREVKP